jgi:hypothetical protein
MSMLRRTFNAGLACALLARSAAGVRLPFGGQALPGLAGPAVKLNDAPITESSNFVDNAPTGSCRTRTS